MKNKKSTVFILLLLCVVVWGAIGWKVYGALKDSPAPMDTVSKPAMVVKEETVSLLLNYRDPFLDDYAAVESSDPEPFEESEAEYPEYGYEMEPEIGPDFQYKGTIRIGQTLQAIVVCQGESMLVKIRERIGEYVVSGITEKQLVVVRDGRKYDLERE